MKKNPAKFKVLYINCHGGKHRFDDKSYAVLSKPHEEYFDYGSLHYLLAGRRSDEYYFIYLAPCYSGGLFESYVHNDVDNPNYTIRDPDESLGRNYFIWYSDCANSPSWGITGGRGVCDLFDFRSARTYKEHAEYVNNVVQECRSKNIALLASFMSTHYNKLKNDFLDSSKLMWTSMTYQESVGNANNLLI